MYYKNFRVEKKKFDPLDSRPYTVKSMSDNSYLSKRGK